MADKIILTGDCPTGKLHVGHYVGSPRRRAILQSPGEYKRIMVMIANAQALTDNFDDSEKVKQNIVEVVLDYLSVGLDPEKSALFIQLQISELTELTSLYSDLVTVVRLQRNPTVKNEVKPRNFGTDIPVGFFIYPISQAVDVTAFKATTVPVGEDQLPMIGQTREIVRKLNPVYAPALVELEALIPSDTASRRLPGVDGKAKMSKSLGNCIYLSDDADTVMVRIRTMCTDPEHLHASGSGHLEGNTVFTYLEAFSRLEYFERYPPEYASLDELKAYYARDGLGDAEVKKPLTAAIQEELEPTRKCKKEYERDIPTVYEISKEGSERARETAAEILHEVKDAMRINCFESSELIREQVERHREATE